MVTSQSPLAEAFQASAVQRSTLSRKGSVPIWLSVLWRISTRVIQQQYLARWDGRLPQYSLSGNTVSLLSIPGGPGEGQKR